MVKKHKKPREIPLPTTESKRYPKGADSGIPGTLVYASMAYRGNLWKDELDPSSIDHARLAFLNNVKNLKDKVADTLEMPARRADLQDLMREPSGGSTGVSVRAVLGSIEASTESYLRDLGNVHELVEVSAKVLAYYPDGGNAGIALNRAIKDVYGRGNDVLFSGRLGLTRLSSEWMGQQIPPEEMEKLWNNVIAESRKTISRLAMLNEMVKEIYAPLQQFGAGYTMARAVERRLWPSWVTAETRRTAEKLDEAMTVLRFIKAMGIPTTKNAHADIAYNYEGAAELATEAAASFLHSKPRAYAREKVIQFHAKAAMHFAEAGDMVRARWNLDTAIDVSEFVLRRSRVPKQLLRLQKKLDQEEK